MPHGHPDYGVGAPTKTIYPILDVGELAARLGSIVTFDRRGNVIWLDDFESGVHKWLKDISGSGAAVVASAESARSGTFSAKLTTGDTTDDYAGFEHFTYFPVMSKAGFEISFTHLFQLSQLIFTQHLIGGGYFHIGALRYLPPTNKLQYMDENGDWQDLATDLKLSGASYIFHTIKLVIDLSTKRYVRAILNNVEYDMNTLSYYSGVSAANPVWRQKIRAITGSDQNLDSYVDDVIITQNEP